MVQFGSNSKGSGNTLKLNPFGALAWKSNIPLFCISGIAFFLLLQLCDDDINVGRLNFETAAADTASRNLALEIPKKMFFWDYNSNSQKETSRASAVGAEKRQQQPHPQCPIMSMQQLPKDELFPRQGKRHMVSPPDGGLMHLVCCQSTKGPLSVLVHEQWAPLGAKRFLEMTQRGYFLAAGVPLFRCIKGFLCQFGLSSNPKTSQDFQETIVDDINWLPEGPDHKRNKQGVKRYARGYVGYAGSGAHTRNNQFIIALENVETLGGGSPWEVPFGELVGQYSFDTIAKFYTGYGEEGPSQEMLWKEGITKETKEKFRKMDYVTGCVLADQMVQAK